MQKPVQLLLVICSGLLLFHLLILFQIIPFEIVWGGKLKNVQEMYVFELISSVTVAFLITILCIKANYIKIPINSKLVNGILWCFFCFFLLNTIGNLLAKTLLEKSFVLLTLTLSMLLFKTLKNKSLPK